MVGPNCRGASSRWLHRARRARATAARRPTGHVPHRLFLAVTVPNVVGATGRVFAAAGAHPQRAVPRSTTRFGGESLPILAAARRTRGLRGRAHAHHPQHRKPCRLPQHHRHSVKRRREADALKAEPARSARWIPNEYALPLPYRHAGSASPWTLPPVAQPARASLTTWHARPGNPDRWHACPGGFAWVKWPTDGICGRLQPYLLKCHRRLRLDSRDDDPTTWPKSSRPPQSGESRFFCSWFGQSPASGAATRADPLSFFRKHV